MNEAKKCLKLILELIVAQELCTEGLKYDTSGFKFISENVQLWDFGGVFKHPAHPFLHL